MPCARRPRELPNRLVDVTVLIGDLEQHAIDLEAAEGLDVRTVDVLPGELGPVHVQRTLIQRWHVHRQREVRPAR